MGRAIRFREKMELNLRIEFANIFNRAEAPKWRANGGLRTDFHHNHRRDDKHPNPTSRQGTVVARFIL
jgi:hypothetical protein